MKCAVCCRASDVILKLAGVPHCLDCLPADDVPADGAIGATRTVWCPVCLTETRTPDVQETKVLCLNAACGATYVVRRSTVPAPVKNVTVKS